MGDSAERFPDHTRQSAETPLPKQPSEPTQTARWDQPGQTDVGPEPICDQHEPIHHDHTHEHPVQNSRSAHGHHHGDHHRHHHVHHHLSNKEHYNGLFALGLILNIGYIVFELLSGWLGNSLALIADAGHNVSDVLGLLLAWGAYYVGNWKPTERHTYGWRSASILAALGNATFLLVATGAILWEALHRLANPEQTGGFTVMIVAALGVVVNGVTASLFFAYRKDDLNLRGVFLHMAADAGVSLAVVVAGAAIWLTGWTWFDPVAGLIVALVILWSTWDLARESIHLSLQAVPWQIELTAVRRYLESLPGVTRVHDLHIWAMSTTENALTAHLVKPILTDEDRFLAEVSHTLLDRFGIVHTTIQIERDPDNCQQACAETAK